MKTSIIILWTLFFCAQAKINKEMFDQIIDNFEETYAPIIQDAGAKLIIEKKWEKQNLDAIASQDETKWKIEIYGGIASNPYTNSEVLYLILCHEVGHHLGMFPQTRISNPFDKTGYYMAVEGQADYFATSKCIKRFVDDRDKVFDASLRLLSMLAEKHNFEVPSMDLKDENIVDHTIIKAYPSFQCRLDTFKAGFDCPVDIDIPFVKKDAYQGACLHHRNFLNEAINARPRCWYRPKNL